MGVDGQNSINMISQVINSNKSMIHLSNTKICSYLSWAQIGVDGQDSINMIPQVINAINI
jgi:hypothetical protein